ncbi:hypothetical protein CDIK_3476 [Cucumispora dikerogammari]|nr:hypothetical protein CDIK_3476 [Cucumispora dikerogammari]
MLIDPFSSYKTICFFDMYKLFQDLASTHIFNSELNGFMVYINKISFLDHNFSYFIDRLDSRIYEKKNNPIENLRVCLYLNNGHVFDVNKHNQILDIYHILSNILRFLFQPKFYEKKNESFLRIEKHL